MKISEKLKTGLTNAEKIECYKNCINHFEKGINTYGTCDALEIQFEDGRMYNNYKHQEILFPEFYAKKPANAISYWFKSNSERIQVLNELIAELS